MEKNDLLPKVHSKIIEARKALFENRGEVLLQIMQQVGGEFDLPSRRALASMLRSADKREEALAVHRKLIRDDSVLSFWHRFAAADLLFDLERPQEVPQILQEIPKKSERYWGAQQMIAKAFEMEARNQEAVSLLRAVIKNAGSSEMRFSAMRRLVTLLEKENRLKEALKWIQRLVVEFPTKEGALRRWPAVKKRKDLPANRLVQRAEQLLRANYNNEVLDTLNVVQQGAVQKNRTLHCRLLYTKGKALRQKRHYRKAAETLQRAKELCRGKMRVKAHYLWGKVVSLRKNGILAIPILESFAKKYPQSRYTDDVLFWAGDLMQRRKRYAEALSYYGRIARNHQKGDYRAAALWRMAWIEKLRDRGKNAFQHLEGLYKDYKNNPQESARALYWMAWLSRGEKASVFFEKVIQRYPLTYYGVQALSRLAESDAKRVEVLRKEIVAKLPTSQSLLDFRLEAGALGGNVFFREGIALLHAGLKEDASERLLQIDEKKVSSKEAVLLLALALHHAGAVQEAQWMLRKRFASLLQGVPSVSDALVWQAAYPQGYEEVVSQWGVAHGVSKVVLTSLIREESAFFAGAISWAGARGLTQLMPETGVRVAKRIGLSSPSLNDLLSAELNIRLGSAELGYLLKRYENNIALALCGYNAGEERTDGWLKRNGKLSYDEFVEEIPIRETRRYTKRNIKTQAVYHFLYGKNGDRFMTLPKTLVPKKQ